MPAKFNLLAAASITLVPLIPLLACGGDSKSPDASIHVQDSGSNGSNGSGSANCTANTNYGAATFGSAAQQAKNYPTGTYPNVMNPPHVEDWTGALDMDEDLLDISFWAKSGGFGTGDVRPGTYPLTGSDLDPNACGICPAILPNITQSTTMLTDIYLPTGGTITITSAGSGGSGTLSGTFSNLAFAHYAFGSDSLIPLNDGCTSMVTSGSFNATLTGSAGLYTGKIELPSYLHRRYQ